MSLGRIAYSERILTHGVLIAGAIIVSFPFLWMFATSAKVKREMLPDRVGLLPLAPRPVERSPYVDPREFRELECPDGIPQAVWDKARPSIETHLSGVLATWSPQTPGEEPTASPAEVDGEVYTREMLEGLFDMLGRRISDTARGRALALEKARRLAGGTSSGDLPPEHELLEDLGTEAIRGGAEAVVREAARLVEEKTLRETFDACYRRLFLGQVRIRTKGFGFHNLYTGSEWRVVEGPAELVERRERATPVQEVRLHFTAEERSALFELRAPLLTPQTETGPLSLDDIDRVYVGFRPDDSWADVAFEVIRDGTLYRTRDKLSLATADSLEQELRWEPSSNPMARRPYLLLHAAGAAPVGSPDFAVRMRIVKQSAGGAWLAKLTRNYRRAFKEVNFARYIATSFALSILSIILAIFACTLTGYAFARLEWPGRNLLFGVLLATMMLPPQVTMIPTFLIYKQIGWYNTLLPLWVPYAFGTPFFVFLLRQFFKNVPKDLEDAARIDGCGFLRIYWHVMLPLVRPTIAVIAIFTFMAVWNNFMGPLIYVTDERLFPLALGMFKFARTMDAGNEVGLIMAGAFVMTLPIIVLFFFVQRYFIQGVSLTGMKS